VFVIFNVQNNNEFACQKNEIDYGFKAIDKGGILIGKSYIIDLQ